MIELRQGMFGMFVFLAGSVAIPGVCRAADAVALPGTEQLQSSGDIASRLVDGVDRFLVPSTSVAVRPLGNTYEAYVPNGLSILYALRTASGDTRAPGNR